MTVRKCFPGPDVLYWIICLAHFVNFHQSSDKFHKGGYSRWITFQSQVISQWEPSLSHHIWFQNTKTERVILRLDNKNLQTSEWRHTSYCLCSLQPLFCIDFNGTEWQMWIISFLSKWANSKEDGKYSFADYTYKLYNLHIYIKQRQTGDLSKVYPHLSHNDT